MAFFVRLLLLAVFSVALTGNTASAQRRGDSVTVASGRSAVQVGVELERSRRWLEAIRHYEEALENWPDNEQLEYGLRRSKIHFGIDRRYADGSFEKDLLRKSRYEALSAFDDVLDQVRSHFVDPISSTSFVAHGTESLYLALRNERFTEQHLQGADPARVNELRRILRRDYWNKPVRNQAEARRVVEEVIGLSQRMVGLPPSAVIMEYVFGGFNALDDYSDYLTPDRLDDLYGNIEGEFVGLGIEMKAEPGKGLLLVNVLPNSPAQEGGLKPDEHIVAIDGVDCRRHTTEEAAKLLRGPSGSRVRLNVHDSVTGRDWSGEFVRRAVQVKSIPVAEMIDSRQGIAYLRMTGFQKTTPKELDAALAKLDRQGMRALVWDVRGNPGGLLTAAVEVLDRFVDGGVLVSTKGRTADQNWSYSARRPGTWRVPIVLLVDGDSASASEIVAGALRDHDRGTIVGRQTYGKWSVQSIFPMRSRTGLRLTTAKFYSPKGLTHGNVGVRPHVVVREAPEPSRRAGYSAPRLEDDADVRKAHSILVQEFASR